MMLLSRLQFLQELRLIIIDKKASVRYHPWFSKNWDILTDEIKQEILEWSPSNNPKEAVFYFLHNTKLLEPFKCVICGKKETRFTGFELYPRPFNFVCQNKQCQVKFKQLREKENKLTLPDNLNAPEEKIKWLIDNKVIGENLIPYPANMKKLNMLKQDLYNWIYDIKEIPICPICKKNPKSFISLKEGYGKTCSDKQCQAEWSRLKLKERYGTEQPNLVPQAKEKIKTKQRTIQFNNLQTLLKSRDIVILDPIDKFINESYGVEYRFKCLNCNKEFIAKLHPQILPWCDNCKTKVGSNLEIFVKDILEEYYIEYKRHVKQLIQENPKLEVDFYIPEYRLAIEVNGLYYHSYDIDSDESKELDKSLYLKNQGIKLLHIFEDSIYQKPDVVKSIILNNLGIHKQIYYARDLLVSEIDTKTSNKFLDKYHLNSYGRSHVSIGLYTSDNLLLSVMTFRKFKDNDWIIDRYAIRPYIKIIGGFPKIMSYFTKKYSPNKITTYLHVELNNLPETSVYYRYGFKLIGHNEDFYCVYNNRRYHRLFCNKKNLLSLAYKLDYDPKDVNDLTQFDLAKLLDIKIIRLGSWKFEKEFDSEHRRFVIQKK